MKKVHFLELSLHGHLVGWLAGFQDGRNILHFAPEFSANNKRPTLSILTYEKFPRAEKLLSRAWQQRQRLHPLLSNLLPEGALRELITRELKIHIDNEFEMFTHLGGGLPGALIAKPLPPDQLPPFLQANYAENNLEEGVAASAKAYQNHRFSLAGVQLKFSIKLAGKSCSLTDSGTTEDWIIKTPSTQHKGVVFNEYSAMRLAEAAGVYIPEIKLVEHKYLHNTSALNLSAEPVYAIKRFDRQQNLRIHSEDFAQVLAKYPHEKYDFANYQQIGTILYRYSGDGLADVQQFARRLLVNILLGNGDAHLKNWSLIYPDRVTPRLSPAYDIVFTRAYLTNEQSIALNLAGTKKWYQINLDHFAKWAKKADIPWRAVKVHLTDTLERAREKWQKMLAELPMNQEHKKSLRQHWSKLHRDFRI
ncbi:MAG: phosphatidylinositol kinase [Deltaproteobacteria bacterium]|nr:MAG: phosphatidylinositol kinase [Deltaproteobacteria bacterium]